MSSTRQHAGAPAPDDDAIRAVVTRLARPHRSGGGDAVRAAARFDADDRSQQPAGQPVTDLGARQR